jgi:hypothetical protein
MRLRHLIIASTYIIAFTVQGTALGDMILSNKNLPGNDYKNLEIKNFDACRDICHAEGRCQAWTFVKPGIQGPSAHCWLKDKVPTAVGSPCCDSGTKEGGGIDGR